MKDSFISHGDFSITFEFIDFFYKHFFLWSDNSSSLSFDGIIRLFSKLPVIFTFWITESPLFSGYFYIIFILIFSGVSAYLFLRKFLHLSQLSSIIGTLLYIINPAFLGNYAKIGIIFSVSSLPIGLVFLKKFFQTRKFYYLIYIVLLLNISLLHPFAFFVNFIVFGAYSVWELTRSTEKRALIINIFFGSILFLILSLYFILPIINVGTVSKDAIQNKFSRGSEEVDYTKLVDIANTDGLVNAFSSSKNIFLDFVFFPENSAGILFFGVSLFLLILIVFPLFQNNWADKKRQKAFLFFIILYLLLILLSSVNTEFVSKLIKWIITYIPGGWVFRSPLKWQFYIPLCLMTLLALNIEKQTTLKRIFAYTSIFIIFLANFYILLDIGRKLLTPKILGPYQSLNDTLSSEGSILSIRGASCGESVNTENLVRLNQILNSTSLSVYTVNEKQLATIPIASFNYVSTCAFYNPFIQDFFERVFQDGAISLYKNLDIDKEISAFSTLRKIPSLENIEKNYRFLKEISTEKPQFSIKKDEMDIARIPAFYGQDIFESIQPNNIVVASVEKQIAIPSKNFFLYARTPISGISLDTPSIISLLPAQKSEQLLEVPVKNAEIDKNVTVQYVDSTHDFSNRIPNSSFEEGLWKEKVGDCNNFDKNGLLDMKHSSEASDGSHSLELRATRHIACTNQKFPVTAGRTYLFSFDYQSPNAKQVGFHIGFDNPDKSAVSEKIPFPKSPSSPTLDFGLSTLQTVPNKLPWSSFTKQITVPDGATHASLTVYSYSTDNETDIVTRYDNFSFIELPDIFDRYYLVSDPETNFVEPRDITFDLINPTKKLVHIKGATTPFYLAMSESYHPQWQAQFTNEKINGFFRSWVPWIKPDQIVNDHHFELNGFLNGWYIDINEHCVEKKLCTQNSDGSYDIELTLEFFPQRWFYLGLLISGTTLLGCIGYLVYDAIRRRRAKRVCPLADSTV